MTFYQEYCNLYDKARREINNLIDSYGEYSEFRDSKCLKIKDEGYFFDIPDTTRYAYEFHKDLILDNRGYEYDASNCLHPDDYFELVDYLIKTYKQEK